MLLMLSPTMPESVVRATLGALGAMVSWLKVMVADEGLILPATSVWRTTTLLLPSTGVNVAAQVLPPLVLYSTLAPVSMVVTVRPVLMV